MTATIEVVILKFRGGGDDIKRRLKSFNGLHVLCCSVCQKQN